MLQSNKITVFGVVLLTLFFQGPSIGYCQFFPNILAVENTTLTEDATYQATQTLEVENLASGANVELVLRAGTQINLTGTFNAPLGSTLTMEVAVPQEDLPPNIPSFGDLPNLPRPRLSMIGFDNNGSNHGYGIKQVIERVYGGIENSHTQELYRIILAKAHSSTSGANIDELSRIYQARAFEALMSFILEQNFIDPASLTGLPNPAIEYTHQSSKTRLAEFKGVDTTEPLCAAASCGFTPDPVAAAKSGSNTARAFDMYMALEHAYDYWGLDKLALRSQMIDDREDEVKDASDALYGAYYGDYGSRQPGNAPIKTVMAAAYIGQALTDPINVPSVVMDDAIDSGYDDQWNWQAGDGGNRYWAEGAFYLHFALREVIPFWHMVRATGQLPGNVTDPFSSKWFLAPLEWLADVSMPGGYTPPLDDGNKQTLFRSSVLRWSPAYGNYNTQSLAVSEKFAAINDSLLNISGGAVNSIGADPDLVLVELAIPRTSTLRDLPPYLGNDLGQPLDEATAEQQIVIRRHHNGNQYYVVLNGEHGEGVSFGEGHEQPDNMQLLINVDENSYLVDSGYDNGGVLQNSTWNFYHDHNVLRAYRILSGSFEDDVFPSPNSGSFGGGLRSPDLNAVKDGHKISNHDGVEELYLVENSASRVDVLYAKDILGGTEQDGTWDEEMAEYRRRVLFVDASTDGLIPPYIVDLNMGHIYPNEPWLTFSMIMSYHGNSNTFAVDPANGSGSSRPTVWQGVDQTANNHLYIYPSYVEYNNFAYGPSLTDPQDDILEYPSSPVQPIKRLDIAGLHVDKTQVEWHTAVSFIHPLIDILPGNITSNLPSTPVLHNIAGPTTQLDDQAWIVMRNADTYDIFAAKTAEVYRDPSLRSNNVYTVAAAGNTQLTLSSSEDFGFARISRVSGSWVVDPAYLINFTIGTSKADIQQSYVKGDISNNGKIEAEDAQISLLSVINSEAYQDILHIGDVTGDGTVSTYDASLILQYAASQLTCFPGSNGCIEENHDEVHYQMEWGEPSYKDKSERVPLYIQEVNADLNSFELELGFNDGSLTRLSRLDFNLPEDWIVVKKEHEGKLRIAMAGITPLTQGSEVMLLTLAPTELESVNLQAKVRVHEQSFQGINNKLVQGIGLRVTASAFKSVFPNPLRSVGTVHYELDRPAHVTMDLYDLLGRKVSSLTMEEQDAGVKYYSFSVDGLSSGTYFLRGQIRSEDNNTLNTITQKIVIVE